MFENITQPKKERFQYIDALRGFAMLMVVFFHVEMFTFFTFNHTTTLMKILSSVQMPLFFFISGLCVYKSDMKYGLTKVKEDFLRFVLPAIVVGLIYSCFMMGEDMMFFFENPMKAGYWFTISLFEAMLIYYLIYNLTSKNDKYLIIILWIVACLLYLLKLPFKIVGSLNLVGNYLCLHQMLCYFSFFALGVTISKCKKRVHDLMGNQVWGTIILALFAVVSFLLCRMTPQYADGSILWRVLNTFLETVVGLSGVSFLYVLFYKSQSVFNSSRNISRGLIFIGRNTLSIYFIHYFLLPSLPQVGNFLINYPGFLVEVVLGLIGTFLIVVLSLLVDSSIKVVSPFIGFRLLGNRK